MKTKILAFLIVSLFSVCSLLPSIFAALVQEELDDLALGADRIITGEVTDIHSRWDSAKTTIDTYVTVAVEENIKGSADKKSIVVKVPGGTVGNTTIKVMEAAKFLPKEKVMLFLKQDQAGQLCVKGWSQGKLSIKGKKIIEKNIPADDFSLLIKGILNKEKRKYEIKPSGRPLRMNSLSGEKPKWEPAYFRFKNKKGAGISDKSGKSNLSASFLNKPSVIGKKISGWQTLMSEGFESAFPASGWQVFDAGNYSGEFLWGKDDYRPYSGTYSLWCARAGTSGRDPQYNNYPNYCESAVTYGPFDLSDASAAEVILQFWLESESSFDLFYFLVSIDETHQSVVDKIWYGAGLSGSYPYWQQQTFDLTDVPGLGNICGKPNVWIAALFVSDYTLSYRGAFIDDVLVRKYISATPPVINNISPNKTPAGAQAKVTITGEHFGSAQGTGSVVFSSGLNSVTGEVTSWSDTLIECVVPEGASSGTVSVTTAEGTSNVFNFTVSFSYSGLKYNNPVISYQINEDGTAQCQNEFLAIRKAFQAWRNASEAGLGFSYKGTTASTGDNHNDNENIISWGPIEGNGSAIAATYIRYQGNAVQETDMVFNSSLIWSDSGEANKYDVQSIGTHESGHFLVLADLYGSADAAKTMYGMGGTGETQSRTLEPEDIEGAKYIYPGRVPFICADLDNNGKDETVINFGPQYGLWVYRDNGSWQFLHNLSPQYIAKGNIDADLREDLVIDFGAPYGVWVYKNGSTWQQLHSLSPETFVLANLDADAFDDIVFDFGPQFGVWVYKNGSTWQQLHSLSPEIMLKASLDADTRDELIFDFGPQFGIWIYRNDSGWEQLHSLSPDSIVSGNIDGSFSDLVIDFGSAYGLWIYRNNSEWLQLHNLSPEAFLAADLNNNGKDDLALDFGPAYSIWLNFDDGTWTQLHNLSPEYIASGNINSAAAGKGLIMDFGDIYGIWSYANGNWQQIHGLSP